MHNGNTLRIMLVGAIAAFAVSAPAAVAKSTSPTGVAVCNQATSQNAAGEGNLDSTAFGDNGSSVKYQTNLKAMKGSGAGLLNAAANSPALSQCVVPGSTSTGETPPIDWPMAS